MPKYNLHFELKEQKEKTKVYYIINQRNDKIGLIFWWPAWRRYTSEADKGVVFDADCHREIANFLDVLMEERKL